MTLDSSVCSNNGSKTASLVSKRETVLLKTPKVFPDGWHAGDPIEVGALGQALSLKGRPAEAGSRSSGGVALASVKSAYGHTEGAAGLTGALLAVCALQAQVGVGVTPKCCIHQRSWLLALHKFGASAQPQPPEPIPVLTCRLRQGNMSIWTRLRKLGSAE